MSSYSSEKRRLRGRQEDPSRKVKKSGDSLNMGVFGNKSCEKYINKVNFKMPEKLNYKKTKDKNEKMSSVKKTSGVSKEDEKDIKKNRKIGEIKLDTGVIEVGYDEEKDEIIISFVQGGDNNVSNEINEASATSHKVYNAENFQSNDSYFYGGAMSIKYNIHKPELAIKEQFKKVSEDFGGETTVDEVIPFNQTKEEELRLKELKDLKRNNTNDRSNIHSVMSYVNDVKNLKGQKELSFKQKIDKAVQDTKQSSKYYDNRNDSYLLYLLRKRLKEEGLLPDDDDNNDKNNEINKEDENEKVKQTEIVGSEVQGSEEEQQQSENSNESQEAEKAEKGKKIEETKQPSGNKNKKTKQNKKKKSKREQIEEELAAKRKQKQK